MCAEKKVIKKVFPGGNTSQGFYSFYDYIIEHDANRIFVIKGGPGVGKSTLMKNIGNYFYDQGYDVEFHCCSSDNGSLDGVKIPKLGVALLDGTAPHVVDPKNPGVVDEIIHLGDFWIEEELVKYKDDVLKINKEIGRCFYRAYLYLAQCKLLQEEITSYYVDSKCVNSVGLNKLKLDLAQKIFANCELENSTSKERHLFGSGITPEGPANYLDSIFGQAKNYILTGSKNSPDSGIVKRLYKQAVSLGLDVEVYHCSLRPDKIEHLYIPKLNIGVISSFDPHTYTPSANDEIFDLDQYTDSSKLAVFKTELDQANDNFVAAFAKAVSFISLAKMKHDIMENYYIKSMNFDKINTVKENLIKRISQYSE